MKTKINKEEIEEFIKKYKLQFICVGAGFALFAIVTVLGVGKAEEVRSIERAGYSQGRTENLYVEGLEEDPVAMSISVEPRRYRDDEVQDAIERCLPEAVAMAQGDNPSMDEVYHNLSLKDSVGDYGFLLSWTPQDQELIRFDGTVVNEDLTEPVQTELRLTISNDQTAADYAVPVTVMPKQYTDAELREKGFTNEVAHADADSATEESVVLPDSYDGKRIIYRAGEDANYNFLWILGIVFAALLLLRDKENAKKADVIKYKQMQLDYPEIVSKLMVFVGAGMSVRMAWNAIATDYEESWARIEGTPEERYAYIELCKTNSRIKTGTPEGVAYRQFGRECKSKQYMKLASLLEQNRKTGVANMKSLLQTEMIEAWAERKNLALRQGEEASTKLMLPLMMLLIIVMVIIMVPALMSM